ncbi:MAG: ABC transporter substrate-binding protein [Burkholderiales bacterium]|nr:ABC transporter substrate-binding protein [Burkholderiales bacterium]
MALAGLGTAPAPGWAQDTIRIGVIQPLSGPVAASGNFVTNGARIGADWINERGGVLGRKFQLFIEDNKSDPKETVTVAEKLIVRDKVVAIMGAWGSSMTLAAMPVVAKHGVPLLVETSSSIKITKQGNPWVFRISPPSEMEAIGLEKVLRDDLKVMNADFLAVNTDWGRGAVTAFGDVMKKYGGKLHSVDYLDQTATDMYAQLTKIKNSPADWLLVTTDVSQIALIMKQAAELGIKKKLLTTGGSSAPNQLITIAGPAAEGSYHVVIFLPWFPEAMPDPALAKRFVDEWNKRGLPFEGLTESFRGVDAMMTLARAIEIAGKAEPTAIRDALRKVELTALNGPIKFDAEGQSQPSIYMIQIRDGKIVLPSFMQRR